ncbi:MAG: hypothetical protein JXB33_05625 [Clostridia bacterium]|nr:hypothetical protein [Clostridia bacterium]
MKKAAVITVSIILFVILLGLNYLLWDISSKKESIQELESKEMSKQESLDRVLIDLYEERENNLELQARIAELEKEVSDNESEIHKLITEKLDLHTVIGIKNDIIYQLKKTTDTRHYRGILEEWAGYINNGEYFYAYSSHSEKNIFNGRTDILFTRYGELFMNIEFMEITDMKVRVLDNADAVDEEAKNRLVFDVLMNVELLKDGEGFPVEDPLFDNGINHFKVTMSFDMSQWKWIIWTIE